MKKICSTVLFVLLAIILLKTDSIKGDIKREVSVYYYEILNGQLHIARDDMTITVEEGKTLGEVIDSLNLQTPSYIPEGVKFLGWDKDSENFREFDAVEFLQWSNLEIYALYDKYPVVFNKIYINSDNEVCYNRDFQYIEPGGSRYDIMNFDVPESDYTFVRWKCILDQTSSPEEYLKGQIIKGENDIVNSCINVQLYPDITIVAKYEEVAIVECAIKDFTGKTNYTSDYPFDREGWFAKYMIVPSEKVHPTQKQWLIDKFMDEYADEIEKMFDGEPIIKSIGGQSYDVEYISENTCYIYSDVISIEAVRSDNTANNNQNNGSDNSNDSTKNEQSGNNKDELPTVAIDEDSKMDKTKIDKVKKEIQSAIEQMATDDKQTISQPVTIHIDMKKEDGTYATAISKDVIEQAKGSNVILSFDMGEYIWEIDGKDISEDKLVDIDMEVSLDTSNISDKDVDKLGYKEHDRYQISLKHHGQFGFKAKLKVNLDKKNSGKYGNLYYFNDNGEWEYMNSGYIDESGNVELEFIHASEYVVLIGDKLSGTENANEWMLWSIVSVVVIAVIGMVIYTNIPRRKHS